MLREKNRDYRFIYIEKASQIDFSTLSIAKLTFTYIEKIGELIQNQDSSKKISLKAPKPLLNKIRQFEIRYPTLKKIISIDSKINEIKEDIATLYGKCNKSVLILGENGTGKELIAEAIRETSQALTNKVIIVNCANFIDTLLEADLFGYKKGAFTGAIKDTIGKIEAAKNGILFLDEIGDLPLNQQAKFLRLLQNKTITKLGDTKEIKVNFRFICATNKDLFEEIQNGRFRRDLYFRINKGFRICIPPLRERYPDDIEALSNHFLNDYNKKNETKKLLSSNSIDNLKSYHWPGNVRELEGVIFRNAAHSKKDIVEIDTSEFETYSENKVNKKKKSSKQPSLRDKQNRKDDEFFRVLRKNNWHRGDTAKELNVSEQTVWRRMKKLIKSGYEIEQSPFARNKTLNIKTSK